VPFAVARAPVQGPGLRGEVGYSPKLQPATVCWVMDGVQITTDELGGEPGFLAVVEVEGVHKDVSLSDLIHDKAYDDALELVKAAREKLDRRAGIAQLLREARYEDTAAKLNSVYAGRAGRYRIFNNLRGTFFIICVVLAVVSFLAANFLQLFGTVVAYWTGVSLIVFAATFVLAGTSIGIRMLLEVTLVRSALRALKKVFPKNSPQRPVAREVLRDLAEEGNLAEKMTRAF